MNSPVKEPLADRGPLGPGWEKSVKSGVDQLAYGGEPPHDGDMEARISKLEAIIPTLATKADMAELRTDIEKGQKENRTWMLATVIALFLGVLGVGNFIASGLRDSRAVTAPTQPAPIIIQVPSAPPPATAPSPKP